MAAKRYFEPSTVDEAITLLAENDDAKLLAGGASLVAMMNARLVEPSALVSLRRIDELRGITIGEHGSVRIGSTTLHAEVASDRRLVGGHAVVRQAAGNIASPPVRNMGTIGGSISHSDPAADYPAALVAADALIEAVGPEGRRSVRASEFFVDWYTTALADDELVTAVTLVPPPVGTVSHYEKLVKVEGDLCIASVALVLAIDGGKCSYLRLAVGGCGPGPVRIEDAEARLIGGSLDEETVGVVGARYADALDPPDDVRASADYRRLVVPRLIARAINEARKQADASA